MKLAALVAVASGKSATFLDWLHHAENSGKFYLDVHPILPDYGYFIAKITFCDQLVAENYVKTFKSRSQCRKLDPF